MKSSTVIRVVILGAIATIGIIALQSYWVISTWNINEEEFNQKVTLALHDVAKSLADLQGGKLPPREVIKQRTSNYYVVNIEDEIDANLLEYFLQTEFEKRLLHIDFEYAVYNCNTNKMEYGKYCSYSPATEENIKPTTLPKYDQFTYYFGVKFPTRSGHLFSKMQLSILFSLIMLITIIFFAYSMFVILRQKRLSEMQKDFINNMTHEFKTPISTIKISSDVFLNTPIIQEDKRLHQYASIIRDQNLRLDKQVEKVLQLAKIEKDTFRLLPEEVDLKEILHNIAQSTELRIQKLNGSFSFQLPACPLIIKADRLHLTNILDNLLDNAIKYCKGKPEVLIKVVQKGKRVMVEIKDKGIGIPKEHLHRVFNKFYRVPTGNVHNVKGFGLGLFYVKNICIAHGWKIQLESSERGTTFCIAIPLKMNKIHNGSL